MRKPKEAKNLRRKSPRVCATCKHGEIDDGMFECKLPNGASFDVGDMKHWEWVCDTYERFVYTGTIAVEKDSRW